jgi:hypothetical protein
MPAILQVQHHLEHNSGHRFTAVHRCVLHFCNKNQSARHRLLEENSVSCANNTDANKEQAVMGAWRLSICRLRQQLLAAPSMHAKPHSRNNEGQAGQVSPG